VIRAAFFDVGDTLVRRPTIGPGRRIAAALGLAPEHARAITRLVFCEPFASPAALAARLRADLGLGREIDEPIAAIWHAQEREPIEVEGATACVAAARAAGLRVGVISNIWPPYETGFRRACPALVPLVESWHLSYRAGVAKPDPALFEAALAALGVPPAAAVMVGDSLEKDVAPALALGMAAIRVLPADGDVPADAAGSAAAPPGCVTARGLVEARALLVGGTTETARRARTP
jgi:FMN phosphatase YigB (HAD superfamily)